MIGERHERNYLDRRNASSAPDLFRRAKDNREAAGVWTCNDCRYGSGLRRNFTRPPDVDVDYPILKRRGCAAAPHLKHHTSPKRFSPTETTNSTEARSTPGLFNFAIAHFSGPVVSAGEKLSHLGEEPRPGRFVFEDQKVAAIERDAPGPVYQSTGMAAIRTRIAIPDVTQWLSRRYFSALIAGDENSHLPMPLALLEVGPVADLRTEVGKGDIAGPAVRQPHLLPRVAVVDEGHDIERQVREHRCCGVWRGVNRRPVAHRDQGFEWVAVGAQVRPGAGHIGRTKLPSVRAIEHAAKFKCPLELFPVGGVGAIFIGRQALAKLGAAISEQGLSSLQSYQASY